MEVGVIGLGRMGAGIAHNLLKAGHQLTVFNRSREKTTELAAAGAEVADRPADACNADVVISMLSGDAVEEIVLGPRGVAAAMPAASIHVSMSTIGSALSQRLAAVHQRKVQRYVAAPVFGRPDAATAGRLMILAAGRADTVARCRPLFDVIGQTTVVSDRPEVANVLHLSGVALVGSVIQALGEAMALARQVGVRPEQYIRAMSSTVFAMDLHASYGALIADGQDQPAGLSVEQGQMDVQVLLDTANALGVAMPVMRLLGEQLKVLCAHGCEKLDWSAIARLASADGGRAAQGGEHDGATAC